MRGEPGLVSVAGVELERSLGRGMEPPLGVLAEHHPMARIEVERELNLSVPQQLFLWVNTSHLGLGLGLGLRFLCVNTS